MNTCMFEPNIIRSTMAGGKLKKKKKKKFGTWDLAPEMPAFFLTTQKMPPEKHL